MKLQVRLREADQVLREYFKLIPPGDQAHEARRLMLLGIKADISHKTADFVKNFEENGN